MDLLDELLSMGPSKPQAARPRELTTRAAPPPPPPPIEVIAVRSNEEVARNGGRQVPLESGVLNRTALEPGSVEVISPPRISPLPAESREPAVAASVSPISEQLAPVAEVKTPAAEVKAPPGVEAPPIAEVKAPPSVETPPIAEVKAPPSVKTRPSVRLPSVKAPPVAEVREHVIEQKVANGRPSRVPPPRVPDGSEAVSALPPVVTVPPRGMAKTYVELPAVPARGPRDSLDEGWDASPAPPAARAAAGVAAAPAAVPLPPVRLPWEILSEDTLAADGETVPLATVPIDPSKLAPKAPPEEDVVPVANGAIPEAGADDTDEWANVPDDSLSDDDPDLAAGDALHDAVTGEPSQVSSVSDVLDSAAVAAAVPPAWAAPSARLETPMGSSSVSPTVNSATPGASPSKGFVRRFAPALGGVAVVALAAGGYFGLRGGKEGSRPAAADTSVAAARPARARTARDEPLKLNPELAAALAARDEPARPAPEPSASADPKSTFNSKAANASVARAIGRARACKKAGPSVSAEAVVTFATTGRVVAASVTGHKVGGTPLATCITSTLKTAKVAPFTGEAMTIKKTIKYK